MSEQHSESVVAPSSDTASAGPSAPVSSRTRAAWLLAAVSLLPGVVAALAPEFFHGLPQAFRVTVYVLCGLMIAAVVVLTLTGREDA